MKAKKIPLYTFGKNWIYRMYEDLEKYEIVEEQIEFLEHVKKDLLICYGPDNDPRSERDLLDREIELRRKKITPQSIDDIYEKVEIEMKEELKKYYFNDIIANRKRGMIKIIANIFDETYRKYSKSYGSRRKFVSEYYGLILDCLPLKRKELTIKQLLSALEK